MSKTTWSPVPFLAAGLVAAGLMVLLTALVAPADVTVLAAPVFATDETPPPEITATAAVILDIETGTVVTHINGETVLPIASVTKLFTAAALFELTHFSGTTTITVADVATEGRAGKLAVGEVYPYHELTAAMLLESSNDAAAAVWRAEPTVLDWMNDFGAQVGDGTLNFSDTSGLSSGNVASAFDLARATAYLYQSVPHVFSVTTQSEIVGTYTGWHNNNPISERSDFKGGKHGYTDVAGRTVSAVLHERIDDTAYEFVVVLLDSDNLAADTEQLVDYLRKHVRVE